MLSLVWGKRRSYQPSNKVNMLNVIYKYSNTTELLFFLNDHFGLVGVCKVLLPYLHQKVCNLNVTYHKLERAWFWIWFKMFRVCQFFYSHKLMLTYLQPKSNLTYLIICINIWVTKSNELFFSLFAEERRGYQTNTVAKLYFNTLNK